MALPYKKDLDKYRDMDEDELLNKLSAEELKQLETALEEIDPEVSQVHRLNTIVRNMRPFGVLGECSGQSG